MQSNPLALLGIGALKNFSSIVQFSSILINLSVLSRKADKVRKQYNSQKWVCNWFARICVDVYKTALRDWSLQSYDVVWRSTYRQHYSLNNPLICPLFQIMVSPDKCLQDRLKMFKVSKIIAVVF